MALIECPKCGASISDKATVCPKCGHKRKPAKSQEKKTVEKTAVASPVSKDKVQKQKSSWIVWVVASCLLIAGAVAVVVFLYPKSGKSKAGIDSMQNEPYENNAHKKTAVDYSHVFPDNSTLLKQDENGAYAIVGNSNDAGTWRIVKYNAETKATETIPIDYDSYWEISDYKVVENGILLRLGTGANDICNMYNLVFITTPSNYIIRIVEGCGDVQYSFSSFTTCKYFELDPGYEARCDRVVDSISFTLKYDELGHKNVEQELQNAIYDRRLDFNTSRQY